MKVLGISAAEVVGVARIPNIKTKHCKDRGSRSQDEGFPTASLHLDQLVCKISFIPITKAEETENRQNLNVVRSLDATKQSLDICILALQLAGGNK